MSFDIFEDLNEKDDSLKIKTLSRLRNEDPRLPVENEDIFDDDPFGVLAAENVDVSIEDYYLQKCGYDPSEVSESVKPFSEIPMSNEDIAKLNLKPCGYVNELIDDVVDIHNIKTSDDASKLVKKDTTFYIAKIKNV